MAATLRTSFVVPCREFVAVVAATSGAAFRAALAVALGLAFAGCEDPSFSGDRTVVSFRADAAFGADLMGVWKAGSSMAEDTNFQVCAVEVFDAGSETPFTGSFLVDDGTPTAAGYTADGACVQGSMGTAASHAFAFVVDTVDGEAQTDVSDTFVVYGSVPSAIVVHEPSIFSPAQWSALTPANFADGFTPFASPLRLVPGAPLALQIDVQNGVGTSLGYDAGELTLTSDSIDLTAAGHGAFVSLTAAAAMIGQTESAHVGFRALPETDIAVTAVAAEDITQLALGAAQEGGTYFLLAIAHDAADNRIAQPPVVWQVDADIVPADDRTLCDDVGDLCLEGALGRTDVHAYDSVIFTDSGDHEDRTVTRTLTVEVNGVTSSVELAFTERARAEPIPVGCGNNTGSPDYGCHCSSAGALPFAALALLLRPRRKRRTA